MNKVAVVDVKWLVVISVAHSSGWITQQSEHMFNSFEEANDFTSDMKAIGKLSSDPQMVLIYNNKIYKEDSDLYPE